MLGLLQSKNIVCTCDGYGSREVQFLKLFLTQKSVPLGDNKLSESCRGLFSMEAELWLLDETLVGLL